MNINNFESYINKTILNRGYDYYVDGNVIDLDSQEENYYIFEVQGRELYEVIVEMDNKGEIIHSECDCPYDFGPICKHEVAAYYELRDLFSRQGYKLVCKREVNNQPDIKKVLSELPQEELVKIITDLAKKDAALKNSLLLKYSKGDSANELEKCKRLIEAIVSKYTDRYGNVSYKKADDFICEMEEVLERARNSENPLLALDIAFLVLNESNDACQYSDDSDSYIGFWISDIMNFIGEIVVDNCDSDVDMKIKIFERLMKESSNRTAHSGNEYQFDLFELCAELADVEALRHRLREKLERIIYKSSNNNLNKYYNERLLKLILQIIFTYESEEESIKFIEKHLNYTSFRAMLISKYNDEKNYNKVIELALEGEKQDKEYQGQVARWKELRYSAYKALSLKEEQKSLAKELFFEGNFKYYRELKQLSTDAPEVFYRSLKEELKNRVGFPEALYRSLIVEEKDLEEIMNYVRENPKHIEQFAGMLQENYKDEVIEIYRIYIKSVADCARNRGDYKRVCEILIRYKKLAGKKNQQNMVNDFRALYKKRPAFIDELKKVR